MQEELYNLKCYFPIDDEEIEDYLLKLFNTIILNYNGDEFQFAYMGLHLVFMTYIYNLIWQISKINPTDFKTASIFARPYNGSRLDLNNIKSVFDYKNLPEKDIINYLYLIGLDKSYIGILKTQIEKRNSMAHASGTYDLLDINSYEPERETIVSIIKKCSNLFNENLLISYYTRSILEWFNNPETDIDDIEYFIDEYLIVSISISPIQLKFITELSKNKIKSFESVLYLDDNMKNQICNKHLLISSIAKQKYLINYFEKTDES